MCITAYTQAKATGGLSGGSFYLVENNGETESMKSGEAMTLSAAYLSKLLNVGEKTIDMYLCGYGFNHIQTVKKGYEKYYKFVTEKDLIALQRRAGRKRIRKANQ